MNQYVFILNEQGERITSFVDNMVSKDELLDRAKKEWPDAADYIRCPSRHRIGFCRAFTTLNTKGSPSSARKGRALSASSLLS